MKKKIPEFKSEKEEAEFWDTHSPLDYPDEFEEVQEQFNFNPIALQKLAGEKKEEKQIIALRIEPSQINLAKIIAKSKGSAYQTMIRVWIREKINQELRSHPSLVKRLRKSIVTK